MSHAAVLPGVVDNQHGAGCCGAQLAADKFVADMATFASIGLNATAPLVQRSFHVS